MKKTYIFSLFLIVCFFYACNLSSGNTDQLWFYTHVSGNIKRDTMLTPASFIYLYKDGRYIRDFGVFDYGHWAKKDNQLLLTDTNNILTILPIKFDGLTEMQLMIDHTLVNFEAQSYFASNENNPFTLNNNQWRIHSNDKESDQQIKNRLYNHFQFWESYFLWALDNKLSTVDVRSTPTPIKIYGNGFSLKPYQDLPNAWRSVFYDSADCQKANAIIKDIFEHGNIAWSHSENKYKMFLAAFQQMERYVR